MTTCTESPRASSRLAISLCHGEARRRGRPNCCLRLLLRCGWPLVLAVLLPAALRAQNPLPGTDRLTLSRDDDVVHAKHMAQVRDYFQRRIEAARSIRDRIHYPDFTSLEAYKKSIAPRRASCREMLGLVDAQPPAPIREELLATSNDLRIARLTIPIVNGLSARGLLFSPLPARPRPVVIVCPDAETWPEQFAGLTDDAQPPLWLTNLLARGLTVYIPQSIERLSDHPYCKTGNNKDRRMILYRLGYPVGRTMPGLDVQDVLAAVDHLVRRSDVDAKRVAMVGAGQGGMTALYAAALDPRVSAAAAIDYFQVRDHCWQEPNDRRLSRQLLEFGDAELAALIAPRFLFIVNSSDSPVPIESVEAELARAARFYKGLETPLGLACTLDLKGNDALDEAASFVTNLFSPPESKGSIVWPDLRVPPEQARPSRDQHFEERLKYLRALIAESEAKRDARWALSQSSPADFPRTKAAMLEEYGKLIGHVPTGDVPLNPKTELALSTDKYKLYRITLAVTDTVDVYGNLLVPNEISAPAAAVICQHGLSGTPEMTTGLGMTKDTAYHEFARHLAEHGYVVFSPYLMQRHWKEINVLVRQADALGMMRVAMPVAKTRRVVDFFETLPFVDPQRIGYYGLSYGGYSAIWISPLEPRLAATVISGHFNDWRSKITNDTLRTSYLWHPDEDFYNWNVLHRFTHPELIAMIAPRPACVEFGQRDGITTPEWTDYAWKQVLSWRDRLGLSDRISLAHYDGVHEIHAVEAVDFLDRFLRPERPVGRDYETTDADGPEPFLTHVLDSQSKTHLTGRFWIPSGASRLHGMAVKLTRTRAPGPLEIRFGSRPDAADLGTATVDALSVGTEREAWRRLEI
ncbi:MAG: dienelactone hydrolase family protein, partial [Planctomycetes bacterium]|nr:dienelactone hydrolase family protein [Planctomycetota bacterium]